MSEIRNNGLQFFVIIAEQKKKNKFLSLLIDHGAYGIEVVYAHGSMSPSALAAAFGFEAEQSKVLITCLMKNDDAKRLMDILSNQYNFLKPNTGFAFTIPVEGLSF